MIHSVSAQGASPDFMTMAIKDSDELLISEGNTTTIQFWFVDPDGGYEVQEVYLRFFFNEDFYIDLQSQFESWEITTNNQYFEILRFDTWVDDQVKRLDLTVRFFEIPVVASDMYVQVNLVDVNGLQSGWDTFEEPVKFNMINQKTLVDSERGNPNFFWFLMFMLFPVIIAYLLISSHNRKRRKKHPAYMDLP
ncbi:MAG: hypothetical protein ACTSPB_14545 [Candidatus Thorarchaeota archaeon]